MLNHNTVVPSNFRLTEQQIADRIGREYLKYETEGVAMDIEAAVEAIIATNDILYAKLWDELSGNVTVSRDDPYESFEELCEDIEENNHLAVFSGGTYAPYFGSNVSRQRNVTVRHRAVHDYWGHYVNGVDFSLAGEFAKWHHQKTYYPEHCHRLLFSDVVGQTAVAYHLEDGFSDDRFVQKSIMAPQQWIDLCYKHIDLD